MLDDPLFVSSSPIVVKWEVTRGCNLRCEHCYAKAGRAAPNELQTEEAFELIDRFAEIGSVFLQFTGGEPLIREDFLDILKHAKQHNFCTTLLTNATLITSDLAKRLARAGINRVQVSLDGSTNESHDKIRGVRGSFDMTVRGIRNLVENGIKVSIASTYSKTNANEAKEILKLSKDLGASGFLFGFVYPVGNAKEYFNDLCLSWREMRRIQKFLAKEAIKNRHFPIYIDEAIGRLDKEKWRPPVCKAGRIMITVTAEGNIVLCPMLPQVILGNVRKDDILDIWNTSLSLNHIRQLHNIKGRCSACDILQKCGGGCRAMSYMETGDLMGSDPYCPLMPKKLKAQSS